MIDVVVTCGDCAEYGDGLCYDCGDLVDPFDLACARFVLPDEDRFSLYEDDGYPD